LIAAGGARDRGEAVDGQLLRSVLDPRRIQDGGFSWCLGPKIDASLVRCERTGVELTSHLRIRELEERLPGLLTSIVKADKKERAGAAK
jgi:hypothetical protein